VTTSLFFAVTSTGGVWEWDVAEDGVDSDDVDEGVVEGSEFVQVEAAASGGRSYSLDFTKRYDVDFSESDEDAISVGSGDGSAAGDENSAPDGAKIAADYNSLVIAMRSLSKRRLDPPPPTREDVIVISDSDE
jgi:hypothetical protein